MGKGTNSRSFTLAEFEDHLLMMDDEARAVLLDSVKKLARDKTYASRVAQWKIVLDSMTPEAEQHLLQIGYALAARWPDDRQKPPKKPFLRLLRGGAGVG